MSRTSPPCSWWPSASPSAGSVLGLQLSYRANLPAGPAIVLTLGGVYLLSMLLCTARPAGQPLAATLAFRPLSPLDPPYASSFIRP